MYANLKDKICKALGLRINLKKDDVLQALSRAFDGAAVTVPGESWVVHIATTPERQVNVTERWLSIYVESGRYSRADIEKYFRWTRRRHHWVDFGDGRLCFLLDGN
jgi:hypothetical protein